MARLSDHKPWIPNWLTCNRLKVAAQDQECGYSLEGAMMLPKPRHVLMSPALILL